MNETVISEIQIVPVKPKDGLLAFCSLVLNNKFYVGDIAIYSRLNREGYRLVYPIKVLVNGAKVNCFHPINREAAQIIESQVVTEFLRIVENARKMKGNKYAEPSPFKRA